MSSSDNVITVEMFNSGIARLEAMNEKNLALIQKENAEFRLQLREDINNFKSEIRSDIENFKNETRAEFSQIHSEIAQLDKRIEVQNSRVDDLFHWNYWIIALFVATFLAPSILEAVKAFSKSLANSVAAIFKRGNKAVSYE